MKGAIRWFADNHVAANLLMLVICVSGFAAATSIKQEVFPEFDLDLISISVPYLGASPAEVEEGVCIKIEEQIQGIEGIKKITSSAREGMGVVMAELESGTNAQEVLDDIKGEVDRIITFPENTEKPIVTLLEPRRQVIDVVIYGDVDERTVKVVADNVRDDLTALPEITFAEVVGTRPYEISIEVSEEALQRYGLSLESVAQAVRLNSLDLPGGSVKTETGEILLRTKGQRYTGDEFARIVVITNPDGTEVLLGDIATVKDGFEDVDVRSRLNAKQAAVVAVYRTGDESVLDVADAAKRYVAEKAELLPAGLSMTTWRDYSLIYRGRMNLLLKNGMMGLVLVFLCLALFLQTRLALWVALGIVVSFLGAFWMLPLFGVSLNMISLFAFIVSLGMVVDDAIVVGENVFAHREMRKSARRASIDGVLEVSGPVTFAVLTTVAAFLPLAYVEGTMGKFMYNVPVVVISVLLFSLVEALLILPAHLSTIKHVGLAKASETNGSVRRSYLRFKRGFAEFMQRFVENTYAHHLGWALKNRALVVAVAVTSFLVTMGFVSGGHIRFTFMPRVDADDLIASLSMPQGTTVETTSQAVEQIERALDKLREEVEADRPSDAPPVVQKVFTTVGSQPRSVGHFGGEVSAGANLAEVDAELLSAEHRGISSSVLARRWRELTGPIPGAVSLNFSADLFRGGKPIQIQLTAADSRILDAAAERLKSALADYPGVTDISDSFEEGKLEMKLSLKEEARTLGLSLNDLARQVRRGFYGAEAMRIQRGRDEVKVMVRYPEDERRSLGNIEAMYIRTPAGDEVPFHRVAKVELGRGYATIERADRQRIVNVLADVEQSETNAQEVINDLEQNVLPGLLADHPGLRYSFEGRERDRVESLGSLMRGFLVALFLIYALLAVLFRSYLQPVVVMLAIPFGLMGAVWGHVLMGWDLTMLSMFGAVALTGVVVNDSLIMIDFINRARQSGAALHEAVVQAGIRRFRPIALTSITTFAGLTPLLLERSLQARFLIPMAISLGFGVMFATGVTLMLVPVGYSLLEEAKARLGSGGRAAAEAAEPSVT